MGKDKHGQDRRIKIPPNSAAFLNTICQGRNVSEIMFKRSDGSAWNRDSWKKLFKSAAQSSKLPEKCTLYSIRHSGITDLVTSGLDLLTTALISGTSVAMIEKYYGHLRQEHASSALDKLSLN